MRLIFALCTASCLLAVGCVLSESDGASVIFVGDTSFGERYQAKRAEDGDTNYIQAFGYDYPLEGLSGLLKDANAVVANLETSLNSLERSPFDGKKTYLHQGDVVRTPAALRRLGIDIVSLANNHAMDYGSTGLAETTAALDDLGIKWIGAGPDEARAARSIGFTLEVGERAVRVAVAAGFEVRRSYKKDYGYYATSTKGGVNGWTPKKASSQIRELRLQEPDALIIAFPHWGSNYKWRTKRQSKLAYALVDAGADLVIGHGAHTIQEIERYRDRWIIYGLGNFVFLSDGRYDVFDAAPYSLIARVVIGEGKKPNLHIDLTPILSNNLKTEFKPQPLDRQALLRVRDLLLEASPESELLGKRLNFTGDALRLSIASDEHASAWYAPSPE